MSKLIDSQRLCLNCKWVAKTYEGTYICLYFTTCNEQFVWQVMPHNEASQCEGWKKKPKEISMKELGLSKQEIDNLRRKARK